MNPERNHHSLSSSPQPLPSKYTIPSLNNPRTQDVFQSIVKGRKSWKTIRGGEIVWPPELEAALIEGLECYRPDDSRETRLLGRYPMRNRFISDYIFHKTGIRRTAKQVGSRLQQLRDTCGGGKKLMRLLSPMGPSSSAQEAEDEGSSSDASSAPVTPQNAFHQIGEPPRTVIVIDLLPENLDVLHPRRSSSEEGEDYSESDTIVRLSAHPRPFRSIDPTITFLAPPAPGLASAQSTFVVRMRDVVVFKEVTGLTQVGPAPGRTDGAMLYSTKLVPGFWDRISESPDPTLYSISQEVVPEGQLLPFTMFSAVYRFSFSSGLGNDQPPSSPLPVAATGGGGGGGDGDTTMGPIFDIPSPISSLDSLLSMDAISFDMTEMEYPTTTDAYYNHLPSTHHSLTGGGGGGKVWDMGLPTGLVPGYEYYFSDDDEMSSSSLSSDSGGYSIDISRYVS